MLTPTPELIATMETHSLVNHPENQSYLKAIRGLIAEMIAPHTDNPKAVEALAKAVDKVLSEETRDFAPLPFADVAVVDPSTKAVIFDSVPYLNVAATMSNTPLS